MTSFTSFKGMFDISFKIISQSSFENLGKIALKRLFILLFIDCDFVLDILYKNDICSFLNKLLLYKKTKISFERSIIAS